MFVKTFGHLETPEVCVCSSRKNILVTQFQLVFYQVKVLAL